MAAIRENLLSQFNETAVELSLREGVGVVCVDNQDIAHCVCLDRFAGGWCE